MAVEHHAALVVECHALTPEQIFHYVWPAEVDTSRQRAKAVHDTMTRQTRASSRIQCPSDCASRTLDAKILGDVAVRSHAAEGNLLHHGPYTTEEVVASYRPVSCHRESTAARRFRYPR